MESVSSCSQKNPPSTPVKKLFCAGAGATGVGAGGAGSPAQPKDTSAIASQTEVKRGVFMVLMLNAL